MKKERHCIRRKGLECEKLYLQKGIETIMRAVMTAIGQTFVIVSVFFFMISFLHTAKEGKVRV
jgi:hypothetical protein